MIANGILIALLAITAWQAYETIAAYRQAQGTTWERVKSAFRKSASIAWARLNAVSVSLTTVVALAADWLGMPGVKEAITPWLTPEYMLAYTLAVLIGAEIARRRSLSS